MSQTSPSAPVPTRCSAWSLATLAALAGLTLLVPGCGGSSSSSDDPDDPDASSNDGELLACDSLAYCSSWWIVGTQVDELPAADGGDVADGLYVLVDVLAVEGAFDAALRSALLIDGDQFRATAELPGRGTLTPSGNRLTFDGALECGSQGEEFDSEGATVTLDYVVDGDTLILFDDDSFYIDDELVRAGLVYVHAPADPCDPGGTVTCTIDDCFCAYAEGEQLPDSSCGG